MTFIFDVAEAGSSIRCYDVAMQFDTVKEAYKWAHTWIRVYDNAIYYELRAKPNARKNYTVTITADNNDVIFYRTLKKYIVIISC